MSWCFNRKRYKKTAVDQNDYIPQKFLHGEDLVLSRFDSRQTENPFFFAWKTLLHRKLILTQI